MVVGYHISATITLLLASLFTVFSFFLPKNQSNLFWLWITKKLNWESSSPQSIRSLEINQTFYVLTFQETFSSDAIFRRGRKVWEEAKRRRKRTIPKASTTYVRWVKFSKSKSGCFLLKYHLKWLLWSQMGTSNEGRRETHLWDLTFAMEHQIWYGFHQNFQFM